MSSQPIDSKREEFRKYLEKGGVMEVLTKVLVDLYEKPERPTDALEFMKDELKVTPQANDVEVMKQEIEDLKRQVEELTIENNRLKNIQLETPPATPGE